MKNNKGFSILELIVSFSICMVVMVVLLEIVITLKEVYEKSGIRTEMLNKENIIVDLVYSDILDKGLSNVESCGEFCAKFTYSDATFKVLKSSNLTLEYGDYKTNILNGSAVDDFQIKNENNVILVRIPVTHKLFFNENFDIKIVHYLGS